MNSSRVLLCWFAFVLLAMAGSGQTAPAVSDGTNAPSASSLKAPLPGVELAHTITTTTGIAISPLFGASAMGAWWYFRTEAQLRPDLPWFSSPWFWGPGLFVVLLLVAKDPVLGLVPGAKKALDAFEVIENKASAIAVAPALIPMFVRTFGKAAESAGQSSSEGAVLAAGFSLSGLFESLPHPMVVGLGTVVFLATFFCVWMAFHAINVLILLSPFGVLDMFLRSLKLIVLLVLVAATLVHAYAGVAVAVLIVAISIPIAGWSFRLTVFGMTVSWDLLSMHHRRIESVGAEVRAFATGAVPGPPARTCGTVSRRGDGCVFSYRPFLVFPQRSIELPERLVLGKAILCPILMAVGGDEVERVVRLAPRYRGHEADVARALALEAVEDLPLLRGLKAFASWLKDIAGKGRSKVFGAPEAQALP